MVDPLRATFLDIAHMVLCTGRMECTLKYNITTDNVLVDQEWEGHPYNQSRSFQLVGVDFMDLPITEQGNKHVLVFQDFLSKWPMVFPIPDQKTIRIVDILVKEIVPRGCVI